MEQYRLAKAHYRRVSRHHAKDGANAQKFSIIYLRNLVSNLRLAVEFLCHLRTGHL